MAEELMLHEEILLLALDDVKGTAPLGSMHTYGMAGGILTELVLRGAVRLERVKKSLIVDASEPIRTQDALLNEVLTRIHTAKRRASMTTWVSRTAQMRKLHERVANGLHERGILHREEGRVLLFFRRQMWPARDPRPEIALVQHIRMAIARDDQVEPRLATVIALARACGLLRLHFEKSELKARQDRIDRIVSGNAVGDAARDAIEAMTAAMIATTTAVTIATSTAT